MSDFEFERVNTIKGYPELHWTGKRPYRGTDYYPAQLKEKYGEMKDDWINKIFWGDNLQVMSHMLKEYRGKIDLIYIDPPFDSKADYKKTIKLKGQKIQNDNNSFEEKQYSDIWTNDEYLQFMYERIILLKELLSEKGSIYLHCDWRKTHQLRMIMDEVFGTNNFKNEIIYGYRIQGVGKGFYARKHDTILFYTKSDNYTFNTEKEDVIYESPFIDTMCEEPDMTKISDDEKNDIIDCIKNNIPLKNKYKKMIFNKYYSNVYVRDVWDCDYTKPLISGSKDYLNYPTQKSEGLLKRIIQVSSNAGDIVFDCFMGSGTTQAVAMKLGRKFIGADINLGSIQTTTKRLLNIQKELENDENKYTGFEVYNVNNYDFFRNPVEAKDLLIDALEIQKFDGSNVYDGELDGRMVKIMPVNRIATKSDLEELKANLPYQKFEKRKRENPLEPVERLTIICMGHEPDLKPSLERDLINYNIDIEIIDILKDKANLQFKRDSEAVIEIKDNKLNIKEFYPMNLLQKLSMQKEYVEDWKQMVESVMIDWNYDGAVMEPKLVDIAEKNDLVKGVYEIPSDASNIKIKITDLLSETYEKEIKINE